MLAEPARSGAFPRLLRRQFGDRLFMGVSIFTRMAVGLTVFMVLARALGPTQYGLFSTVMAYAFVLSLLTDFGLSVKMLRDIAAEPARGGEILAASLNLKALLTLLVCLVGVGVIAFMPFDSRTKLACLMIGAAVLSGSVGDLTLVSYRSIGRFSTEAAIVVWTSAIYALAMVPTALLGAGVVVIAGVFLASRLIYMTVALSSAWRQFPGARFRFAGWRETLVNLRSSGWWAADSGLGFLSGQIDGLIVAAALGLTQAGLYQAGARFIQAALNVAAILSNIHIPRLARRTAEAPRLRTERRMFAEFIGLGLLAGGFFLVAGPWITHYVLGSAYLPVDRLWPGFAAFLAARYAAAAFGAALSATARPALRVGAQVAGMVAILAGFALALPRFGLVASPWVMAAGALVTTAVYALGWLGGHRPGDKADA